MTRTTTPNYEVRHEDEEEWSPVFAFDMDDAVSDYAEATYNDGGYDWVNDKATVFQCRMIGAEEPVKFSVTVDWSPIFIAREQ